MFTHVLATNSRVSRHYLHTFTQNHEREQESLINLTGIFIVPARGESDWNRQQVVMDVPIEGLPQTSGQGIRGIYLRNWTVDVGISSFDNRKHAVNMGVAVDEFGLVHEKEVVNNETRWKPQKTGVFRDRVFVWAKIATRDGDQFLSRLSYNVTLVGRFGTVNLP